MFVLIHASFISHPYSLHHQNLTKVRKEKRTIVASSDWQVINLWSQSFVHAAMLPQSDLEPEGYVIWENFNKFKGNIVYTAHTFVLYF